MTVEDVNRVPAGVIGAGRFAQKPPKAESPVKLFDRNDGSYTHPSPSSTADHCISFWSDVHVPDDIIAQVDDAYFNDRSKEVDEDMRVSMEDWSQKWANENPPPVREKDMDAHNQRYRDEGEIYRVSILPEAKGRRPLELGPYDIRQIIRAYQMMAHRPDPDRFPEESARVLEHPVELYDETLTVREVELKYRLSRIHPFVRRVRPDGSQEAMAAIEAAVREAATQTNEWLGDIKTTLEHTRFEARERG